MIQFFWQFPHFWAIGWVSHDDYKNAGFKMLPSGKRDNATAFQIVFLLFLPFLVIDMVVASILMSLGMMMLSPMLIALPFKLLLFILVDGWTMTVGSLVGTFQ